MFNQLSVREIWLTSGINCRSDVYESEGAPEENFEKQFVTLFSCFLWIHSRPDTLSLWFLIQIRGPVCNRRWAFDPSAVCFKLKCCESRH